MNTSEPKVSSQHAGIDVIENDLYVWTYRRIKVNRGSIWIFDSQIRFTNLRYSSV